MGPPLISDLYFQNIVIILPLDANEDPTAGLARLQEPPVTSSLNKFLADCQRVPSPSFECFIYYTFTFDFSQNHSFRTNVPHS